MLTGTVLRGQVKVGDSIEISDQRLEKKVKSMQMFKKDVDSARQVLCHPCCGNVVTVSG